MAENCGTTRGAGNNRAYEDAVNTRIDGDLQEVESDLPEDIRDEALRVFRAAISDKCTIQDAINKVSNLRKLVRCGCISVVHPCPFN